MAKSSESSFSIFDAYGDGRWDQDENVVNDEYFKHDDAIAARAVRNKQIDLDDLLALQAKSKNRHVKLYDGVITGKIKVV